MPVLVVLVLLANLQITTITNVHNIHALDDKIRGHVKKRQQVPKGLVPCYSMQ